MTSYESYRQKLTRLTQALARADLPSVSRDLASDSPSARARLFSDGNCEKRFEKLSDQLEFVAEAFDDFPSLIESFIRAEPLLAYDTGASDGERMLVWLQRTQDCTAEQLDYIACQRARHAVEDLARYNRLGHVRFQELRSVAPGGDEVKWRLAGGGTLQLNPIRIWATFRTQTLLDDDAEIPADVLFFPVGREIATAVLEEDARPLLEELARFVPCTLAEWSSVSRVADSDRLSEVACDLAEMGMLAVS